MDSLTEAQSAHRTGRSFETLCAFFGYKDSAESFLNREGEKKRILEIGAGDSTFAKTTIEKGYASVVRIDPQFRNPRPSFTHNAITGLGQELPFAAHTFDDVIASFSASWTKDDIARMVQEMARVAREKVLIKPALPALGSFTEQPTPHSRFIKTPYYGFTLELTIDPTIPEETMQNELTELLKSVRFRPSLSNQTPDVALQK
jgi:ubiquinone/menaquinone biosynthesis C-methylase UbiE